jgi:lipoate-protein ligase A
MMNYFLKYIPYVVPYKLTQTEVLKAGSLADSKYKTWEWNWAYGPEYTFNNSFKLSGVQHFCSLFIKDGLIKESIIEGSNKMKKISKKLVGSRHMVNDLSEVFLEENLLLTEEEIFNFF